MKTSPFHYLCVIFLFVTQISFATDYYVSNTGSDSNDGLSPTTAFETLQQAADLVVAGDVVFVDNGTYTGFDLRSSNGTSVSPITFMAMGDNVIINAPDPGSARNDNINIENSDYVIVDGFIVKDAPDPGNGIRVVTSDNCIIRNTFCDNNFNRGIFTGFTDDILIENNTCINTTREHGIYVSNSSDRPIVRYNECYGNTKIGIHMNGDLSSGGDGIISDAQIYGNILHDNNLAAGINMDGLENPIVYNNLIYNNHTSQGIALFGGSTGDGAITTSGAKIYNNTIIVPSDGRWGILVRNGSNVNTEIYNNIIITEHPSRGSITIEAESQFTSDYNILINRMSNQGDGTSITLSAWQALGFDQNSLLADNLTDIFENPVANIYSLKENSQAINAGSTSAVSTIVTDDIAQNSRPVGASYDIGAYEYDPLLGTNDLVFGNWRIYPNPSAGIINFSEVNGINDLNITIYNIHGKIIAKKTLNINNLEPINLSSYSDGLYLIKATSLGRTYSAKILLNREN